MLPRLFPMSRNLRADSSLFFWKLLMTSLLWMESQVLQTRIVTSFYELREAWPGNFIVGFIRVYLLTLWFKSAALGKSVLLRRTSVIKGNGGTVFNSLRENLWSDRLSDPENGNKKIETKR